MSDPNTQIKTREDPTGLRDPVAAIEKTAVVLPGIGARPGEPVTLSIPGIRPRTDEASWSALLSDPEAAGKRRGLLVYIRALLALQAEAQKQGVSLSELARTRGEAYRKALETAWIELLAQNRAKEEAVRSCALFFFSLGDSARDLRKKIFAIDARPQEIASDKGREFLADTLKKYVLRPDNRAARAYVLVDGWVGSPTALRRLGKTIDRYEALLVTNAPHFNTLDKLRDAADNGGILEELPGEEIYHRHMILLGNRGRVRSAFVGRHAREDKDVLIPLAGPWFGSYLDNIVKGEPWKPAVGFWNPIAGVDGVELDLLLEDRDGFDLYLRHRINPCVRLSADSRSVVVWGADTLSKADGGVQMGVAVVEMILLRYAEQAVMKYGIFEDLEKGEEDLKQKLGEFMVLNSGAGRMFRAGSRVEVITDLEKRAYDIRFRLKYREVAEYATIRLIKSKKEDTGEAQVLPAEN